MTGRPGENSTYAYTHSRACLRQIKSTLVYNAQCLSKWLCALLWPRETDRHTVHCLIILLVSCLACHILDKATNQMGGPSTRSQSQFINTQSGEEISSGRKCWKSTGETDFIKIPLQCSAMFLQRDQRLNKSLLCKDKNCAEKMNEAYSMKCSALSCNILQRSELGFQMDQRYQSLDMLD